MATPGKVFRLGTEGAAQVQRDFAAVGKAGGDMGKKVVDGAKAVPPALKALDTAAAEAKGKIDGLAGGAGSLGKVLASMGPLGLAAAAGIGVAGAAFAGLQGAAKGAVDEMLRLKGSATQSGVGVEFLQEIRAAAVGLGRDVTVVEPALKTFAVRLGEISGGIGQASLQVLSTVGISAEQVASFRNAEDGLKQLSDALAKVDDATAFNVADKLGVVDLLPLLREGSGQFDAMAAKARAAGLIIDSEVVDRAAQTAREWQTASSVIDVQLKQALLDAAPAFLQLARYAAEIAAHLGSAVDRFHTIAQKRSESLRTEIAELERERKALLERFGPVRVGGGNPDALGANVPGENLLGQRFGDANARNRFARITRDLETRRRELFERSVTTTIVGGAGRRDPAPPAPGAGAGAAHTDGAVAALQAQVAAFDEAMRKRREWAEIQQRYPLASREELEATQALEATLRDLAAARARGAIASDEELAQRVATAHAAFEEDKLARERAAALAKLPALTEATLTPLQRYEAALRAVAEAERLGAISAEEAARRRTDASATLKDAARAAAEALDVRGQGLDADIDRAVGGVGAEIEASIREGRSLDKEGLTKLFAQFWRDVIYDAFVAQPLHDLADRTAQGLKSFVNEIFGKAQGGKGGGGLVSSILSAVIGGGGGAKLPKRASGGLADGWTEVGEAGRELVRLPFGSRVFDAATSHAMLSRQLGRGGPGPVTFSPTVVIQGNANRDDVDAALRAAEERFLQRLNQVDASVETRAIGAVREARRRGVKF